jgi:2-polyprenyl-3-methyl-5-hydroxy-6-metoxy-1,4-benzoquinol methylase
MNLPNETKCILCSQNKTEFVGEVKIEVPFVGPDFQIYDCQTCGLKFVANAGMIDYNFVYSQTEIYANVLEFARKLRRQEDASWALVSRGHPMYAVLSFLKNKKDLEILDVGCGYGELVWVMAMLGHKVLGIDVARQAIQFAKGLFGDMFYELDIKGLIKNAPDLKFDLITAVEVIEHLREPMEFVRDCASLLKDGGSLILTTPNGDYQEILPDRREQHKNEIWKMEKPPVHWAIFREKTMEYIAREVNLKLNIFRDFPGFAQLSGSPNLVAIFTK